MLSVSHDLHVLEISRMILVARSLKTSSQTLGKFRENAFLLCSLPCTTEGFSILASLVTFIDKYKINISS